MEQEQVQNLRKKLEFLCKNSNCTFCFESNYDIMTSTDCYTMACTNCGKLQIFAKQVLDRKEIVEPIPQCAELPELHSLKQECEPKCELPELSLPSSQ